MAQKRTVFKGGPQPQRAHPMHIPLTPQTDPRNFDDWQFREWPKALTRLCDKEYLDAWLERYGAIDDRTGKLTYPGGRPRIGAPVPVLDVMGNALIAEDEEEYRQLATQYGVKDKLVDPASTAVTVDPDEGTIARLADLEAENAKLKEQLEARELLDKVVTAAPAPQRPSAFPKRGRRPKAVQEDREVV